LVGEAMMAVRNGVDQDVALAAITLVPAQILGIDDRVGSLAAGRDADFVLWTGSPFDPTSRATAVYIDGVQIR
ncbi:MAG: amidohydrolase family protein, partial [Planctomycetes bacterium]|nr:amidohydrolase family protein [Planctomycetota bacterium]